MKNSIIIAGMLGSASLVQADPFGSGTTQFSIDFVEIAHAGNAADTTGFGAVAYEYRMSRHEISRSLIDSYNALSGDPTIGMEDLSAYGGNDPGRPATGVSWNEAARFLNWLNTSQGYSAAYKFGSDGSNDNIQLWTSGDAGYDPSNPFRNTEAYYFLPSEDEWYKAAYYDPSASEGTGGYWTYATGSDSDPTPVASGTAPGTAVFGQDATVGPASIYTAGGLSPLGTMAQNGNVHEWMESGYVQPNDNGGEHRTLRGGNWVFNQSDTFAAMRSGSTGAQYPTHENYRLGFRVASVPGAPQFQIIEGSFTWHEAKADAEARGGRLAVLETQELIDIATTFVTSKGSWPGLWLGLSDEAAEGAWKWLDGSALGASRWQPAEPSGEPGSDFAWIPSSRLVEGAFWGDRGSDAGGVVGGYLYETFPRQGPAAPGLALPVFYESEAGEAVTVDTAPVSGYPRDFTYQWYFNGTPIPSFSGGTAPGFEIDGISEFEGSWRVVVTNSEGSAEASFEYRIFEDTDSDGLSDGREEFVVGSDPTKWDSDGDGLSDRVEWETHGTSPVLADTDSDGFDDGFELSTGFDPNSNTSTPDTVSGILTAVEFWFYAADGVTYRIEASEDLETWSTIETDIMGEGDRVDRLYSVRGQPKRYFRARRN